jgi:hypothetical protein
MDASGHTAGKNFNNDLTETKEDKTMGMGGGGAPQPPKLDVGQSAELYERQLQLQQQYMPGMTAAAGAASRGQYRTNIDFGLGLLGDASLRQRYEAALPEEMQRRRTLLNQLDANATASPEYTRLQSALADTSGGTLGQALTAEAERRAQAMGRLSPEQERDAVQQARASMAARGLATGSAGIGAELLNRDRFVQQRRAQDINLVTGVGAANEQRRVGYAGQSAGFADQERARQLGLRQDAYNFSIGSNPAMMALGMGSPYANMTPQAMQMVSGAQGLSPMYSGGSFSGQGGGGFNAGGAAMGALSGAASGAMIGSVVPGIGTAVGAIGGGLIGGLGGGLSDKREKTDIKKIDGPTNVIGIPAYEYRYKGEKKKRKGVMAQDVQKVLPEAVAEIDYEGKKRLAIKPAVIGAALAEQLVADTKPVALAS